MSAVLQQEISIARKQACCLSQSPTAGTAAPNNARTLYWQALNTDSHPECAESLDQVVAVALARVNEQAATASIFHDYADGQPVALRSLVEIASRTEQAALPTESIGAEGVRYGMLQLSPLMRIEGAHLTGITQLRDVYHASGAALLRVHSRIVGNGDFGQGLGYAFDTDLRRIGVALPELHSSAFVFDSGLDDTSFALPLFLLALAQHPRRYYSQTLGAALFLALVNPLTMFSEHTSSFVSAKLACLEQDFDDISTAIIGSLNTIESCTPRKVEEGFIAAQTLFTHFCTDLKQSVGNASHFSTQAKLLQVIAKLGTCPHGYHKRGRMGGKPIDYWFAPENFSPVSVLKALAKSPYVVPGVPEKSRILAELTQPNGPMFRIFSDRDLELIAAWISTLPVSREIEPSDTTEPQIPSKQAHLLPKIPNRGATKEFNFRDLYFRLVNANENSESWDLAYQYATDWLNIHARNITKGAMRIPFQGYSHAELDRWLERQHAQQVKSYQPLQGVPEETKEEVIDSVLQLAPLTLIDGAWLRGFTVPSLINTEVGSILYHIYVDELGNGDIALHHGNIYRDLVRSMGYDIPVFSSREFSEYKFFEDSSFEVPVFWLSVSLFPRNFMPEILGLNLAMELSGVGGEYRRSGEVLAHYGFSAQFTELHNSIDNVSTGHTAWAIDAIKSHMDEVHQHSGIEGLNAHWLRIWTGYRALRPPQRRFRLVEAFSNLFH